MQRNWNFFLTAAVAFLSNGCFPFETLFKSAIFLILMALTSIVGRMHAPMFVAQYAAILDLCLFGVLKFIGISSLVLTFSCGFLGTFLCSFILGVGIHYYSVMRGLPWVQGRCERLT